MAKFTVNQLAEQNGLDRNVAYALVQFLEGAGLVSVAGTVPAKAGKGRGQNVYEGDASLFAMKIAAMKFPEVPA